MHFATVSVRRWAVPVLSASIVLLAGAAAAAFAQTIPGLPSMGAKGAAPAVPAASEPTAADWAARLEAARAEHRALLELPEGSEPLLAQRQLASARKLVLLAARVDALTARASGAKSPTSLVAQPPKLKEPPPYSVHDVDALRDHLEFLTTQQAALQLTSKSIERTVESAIQSRAEADANLRVLRSQAPRTGPEGGTGLRSAQLSLAELMAQVAELEVIQGDESRQRTRERLEALAGPASLLRAEIDRARSRLRFDEDDLATVLKDIEAERKKLTAESARLAERLARRESQSTKGDAWHQRVAEPVNQSIVMVEELDGLLRSHEMLWRLRRQAITSTLGTPQLQSASAQSAKLLEALPDQRNRLSEEGRLMRAELRTQHALVGGLAADDPTRPGEQQVLNALLVRSEVQDRLRDGIDRTATLVQRTRDDLGVTAEPENLQEWLAHAGARLSGWAGAVWNFELFSASETTRVDGRVITVDYGVTVGKSIGVLVMLVVGYWAAGRLSAVLIALIGRRVPLSTQLARVLRRWANSILLLVVLLLVLKMARIPLTAFAFLGGALAIGVGFGAQNVIKNLISGVIILFERKIRVGDIVSIGGMSGTVINVDLRATTVRGFDGIDAIVPNSTLLENQVSNWSGGNPNIRRAIALGVAYGSDVRKAAQLVTACARAHASVLSDPAPEVLFDNFASDDLQLRLLFWVALGGARGGPTVDSDLRYAIHDALQAAGIGMAFPQRDVHLDMAAPLRVELTRASADHSSTENANPKFGAGEASVGME